MTRPHPDSVRPRGTLPKLAGHAGAGDGVHHLARSAIPRTVAAWPRGLREDQAADYVALSVSTFRREVARGAAPPPVHVTAGRLAWVREDLDAYVDRLAAASERLGAWRSSTAAAAALLDAGRGAINASAARLDALAAEWDAAVGGNGSTPLP